MITKITDAKFTFHAGALGDGLILVNAAANGVEIDEIGNARSRFGIVGIGADRVSHTLLYLFSERRDGC